MRTVLLIAKIVFGTNSGEYRSFGKADYSKQDDNILTKNPLFDFFVVPNDTRREFTIQCNALKKQNIKVELIQVADQIEFKEDKIIATQNYPNIAGQFKQNFKIPLPLDKRNSYIVKVTGKSDVYSYRMNLLQLENKFEKDETEDKK